MNVSRSASPGQLLILELEENRWSASLGRMLDRYRPSGVYLSSLGSPESTAEQLARIARTVDLPPFLWLEEEGGSVDPLRAVFPPLPSPRAVAKRGPSAVERLGELAAAGMALLGFNTNCAPLLDLSTHDSEESLDARAFGSDPSDVARAGEAFVRGLGRHRILACGKHFPGSGATGADRLSKPPIVGKPMIELWHEDLIPYRELLARLPMVMVSHATYKAYDFDAFHRATESRSILRGLLQLKLRYGGLIAADLTRTAEARDPIELGERVARSIIAGCDLVIVPGHEQSVVAALTALESAIESGTLETEQLEQSFKRLRATRARLARPGGRISKSAMDRLAGQFEDFREQTDPKPGQRSHNQSQEPKSA